MKNPAISITESFPKEALNGKVGLNTPLNSSHLFQTGIHYLPGSRFIGGVYQSRLHAQVTRSQPAEYFCQHVLCGVDVTVVGGAALWAGPFMDIKLQLVQPVPATGAGLAGRIPLVHRDHGTAVPLGLVFDHTAELAPSGIGDMLCQPGG